MFGCSARGLVVGVAAAEYCATNLRSRLLRLPLATASTTIRSRGGAVVHVHQGKRFTSSAGPGPAQPPVSTHWTGSTLDDESRSVPENAVYFVLAYQCCTASACGASFFFFFFFFLFLFISLSSSFFFFLLPFFLVLAQWLRYVLVPLLNCFLKSARNKDVAFTRTSRTNRTSLHHSPSCTISPSSPLPRV